MSEPSLRASGYEQEKLQWEDKADMVTISMPMSKECLRSLAVHTDGFTVQLSWGSGSVRRRAARRFSRARAAVCSRRVCGEIGIGF